MDVFDVSLRDPILLVVLQHELVASIFLTCRRVRVVIWYCLFCVSNEISPLQVCFVLCLTILRWVNANYLGTVGTVRLLIIFHNKIKVCNRLSSTSFSSTCSATALYTALPPAALDLSARPIGPHRTCPPGLLALTAPPSGPYLPCRHIQP